MARVSRPNTGTTSICRRFNFAELAAFPAGVIVALCCGLPLLWMVYLLVTERGVWCELHLSLFRWGLLLRTVRYNLLAAVLATAMGLPAGLVLGRGRGWIARAMWVIVPVCLFMPSLAFAYGWAQVVRLCRPASEAIGISFFPGSTSDIFRCIWTLSAWLWAVPACIVGLSLQQMDPSVQLQALLDGGLLRVMLRQLAGPLVVSVCAVTILATQEFSVYEPTGISVVATEVRMVFDTGAFSSIANPIAGSIPASGILSPDQQRRAASALATAVPMVIVTFVLAGLCAVLSKRLAGNEEISIGRSPSVLDAPWWATLCTAVLLLTNIALPIAALFYSLRSSISLPRWLNEFGPAVGGSFEVGTLAAFAGAIVACAASVRWTQGLLAAAVLAFLIGGQLLAIAFIRITNRPSLDWAYDSCVLPVAAYVGRFGWLALLAARTTWNRPWRDLRQMAALDGASPAAIAWHIILPLAWPTLLAGCILLGALSLTEVPATVLLSPQKPQVLTPMLMTWVHTARYDPMIEASLLMVAIVLVPATLAVLLIRIVQVRWSGWRAR